MTATAEQVTQAFLYHRPDPKLDTRWDVDDDTYINNVDLTVDDDYVMGHLLEIVERSSSVVSFLVIVLHPWGRGWDAAWFPREVGTFFDRKVTDYEVQSWALPVIHGLMDQAQEGR